MSSLFVKLSSIVVLISTLFFYLLLFKLQKSSEHERYVSYASSIKSNAGISLSTSPFYKSNDFYLGINKDDYMSFAYAK